MNCHETLTEVIVEPELTLPQTATFLKSLHCFSSSYFSHIIFFCFCFGFSFQIFKRQYIVAYSDFEDESC